MEEKHSSKEQEYKNLIEEKRETAKRALKYEREKEENGKTQESVEEGAEA